MKSMLLGEIIVNILRNNKNFPKNYILYMEFIIHGISETFSFIIMHTSKGKGSKGKYAAVAWLLAGCR